ncbi:Histone deacetylase 8 [Sphaceloma murrayae]|uniref:Histone deacetylase 8 n=1 Tax=Sphaceloma murrayae TaxID=2082308 RepID=A0A2K1R3E1_9PEZI|nr:Histone deacetylase 8 [Sphaceloma murrayae]
MEKIQNPYPSLAEERQTPQRQRRLWRGAAACIFLIAAATWSLDLWDSDFLPLKRHTLDLSSVCPQVEPVVPKSSTFSDLDKHLTSPEFRDASVQRLSDIVKIPSISYDDMREVGKDDRFNIFLEIESYLQKTFPRVHSELRKENVNTHGLLYTWTGSDEKLKPTVLMAHQDVVPVELSTIDAWTHPPFSGHYDGKYIWGRGASDCKNQLIAVLEAVEALLEANYQPKRTVILSFGFDEEISGLRGAGTLAPHILERYGKDSIAAIIDEGAGREAAWGATFVAPAVGEKGYTDVHISIRMPGGHSSVPSPHTSIGVLSELITMIEKDTYRPYLSNENPYLGQLQCGARYSPSFPKKLRHLLSRRSHHALTVSPNSLPSCAKHSAHDPLAEAAALQDLSTRYLVQTSQAVDLISGGAKVNALPELVTAVVNHRVNIGEHPSLPQDRIARLAAKVAKAHNLTLYAYPSSDTKIPGRSIHLSTSDTNLEPAPSTPVEPYLSSGKLSPWGILSGTTRALYGEDVKMAPGMTTGNTDTRYYWDLSRHIFRFGPGYDPADNETGFGNIHTVDERQSVTGHINAVRWFVGWVGNVDEAEFE